MANGHEELIDLQSEWEAEQQEAGYQTQTMLNESKWGLHPRLQAFLDMCHKRITPEKWREIDDRYDKQTTPTISTGTQQALAGTRDAEQLRDQNTERVHQHLSVTGALEGSR